MKQTIYLKRLCLLLLVVICTILLFFLQYRYDNKYHFPGIQGEQGILDLRSDRQPLSVLTYGWEFYPQKLIAPGEFDGQKPHFIYLGQYGGFEAGDQNGDPHGCATYRLSILLPPKVNEYALELPEIYSASRIWVNGRPVSILGDVNAVNPSPSIRTGMITFSAAGKAELVIQAADTRHYYSGIVYPPAFGSVEAVSNLISLRILRTCIMVVASLTIGILYLFIGIKIVGERRRMILFSLVCLFFTIHVMYPLFHLFGAGYWTYYLEDLSFYLFLTAICALHCSLCGIKGRPRRFTASACVSVALASLVVPALLLNGSLTAMLLYSVFLDGFKLVLFSWLITTAFFNREQTETMGGLLLAGLCTIAAALFAQTSAPVFEPVRFGWQTENAGFAFILLLAGGLWFDTIRAYAERTALAENMRLMNRQFSLQEENYRILSTSIEETRKMRHDLRHHIAAIKELTKQKQYDALENYLEGYENSMELADWPVICDNHAANAVLTYFQQRALQEQIPFSIHVSLPAELKLEAWNLGVLLGNLLENAFEASEKLPQELRSVSIYSKITKGNLLITVKNHWNGKFTIHENRIYSSKHEGDGIGLSSVRSMVEMNGGQFYLTPGEDEFEVSLVLWKQVLD
ncbi:sensor histidine kinase [Hungatella sp. L12]|uniref:Sensor histidine kinase n=1 Tax=Hungatella hominis TaxID=2763050 RepID=A0ABR7HDZ3_9FIRM|nr:GHKL domain-containing protein [Hungatella hominis]MBC5711389.1 sensor histidine kinase [Hungatella hominis]